MTKAEMVEKFEKKVRNIPGIVIENEEYSYWRDKCIKTEDGTRIEFLNGGTGYVNNSMYLKSLKSLTLKELKEYFEATLNKIHNALKEDAEYRNQIEKALNEL